MSEPTPQGPVSLYVYYKVAPEQREAALIAITRMQAELVRDVEGLQASLMARSDDATPGAPVETWMEVYRHPQGLSAATEALLTQRVHALASGLIGQRHTERFVELAVQASSH